VPFPVTGLVDDFNRADTGPPPSANWTTGGFPSAANGLSVVSNQCVLATAPAGGYWNAAVYGPESEAYCTVVSLTGSAQVGLYVRLNNQPSNTTGYFAEFASGAGTTRISRLDNGVATALVFAVLGLANGDVVGIEAKGQNLTAYKNGTSILSTTDSTYLTSGNIGLRVAQTTTIIDDFSGGTIPPPDDLGSSIGAQLGVWDPHLVPLAWY
jgi:hypothetical protein